MQKIRKILLLIICLGICSNVFSQTLFCSKISNETIINKEYITISYNTQFNIPNYVGEVLTPDMLVGSIPRMSTFYSEPDYTTITTSSYTGTGYDRGHMAPAADFKGCPQGMYESFSICNVAPQLPKLNRQYWEQLEEYVRKQAKTCDKMYIVTGTIVENSKKINKITVPTKFYKAIIGIKNTRKVVSCAWIYEQSTKKQTVKSTMYTIDQLEEILNVDLFPQLNKRNTTIETRIFVQ